jgi:hypothetical protein
MVFEESVVDIIALKNRITYNHDNFFFPKAINRVVFYNRGVYSAWSHVGLGEI